MPTRSDRLVPLLYAIQVQQRLMPEKATEMREVTDVDQANALLASGWRLIGCGYDGYSNIKYALARERMKMPQPAAPKIVDELHAYKEPRPFGDPMIVRLMREITGQ